MEGASGGMTRRRAAEERLPLPCFFPSNDLRQREDGEAGAFIPRIKPNVSS